MKIIVIGSTYSTKHFIEEIIRQKENKIVAIITLNNSLAYKKSRFVLLDDIASKNKIKIFKINNLNNKKLVGYIRVLEPDLILESGWSQVIPKEVIDIPKKGCIGIHYSYLPKNQGAASLNWALIQDAKEWGVTLFHLVEKIDCGDIIDQKKFLIEDRDNVNTLFNKADFLAVEMLRKNLPLINLGKAPKVKQEKSKASYLPKRTVANGRIDWNGTNRSIHNLIKAITKPYPGAFTFLGNKKIIIWEADLMSGVENKPGKIIKIIGGVGVVVGTGRGEILLKSIQYDDGIEMWADEFARENNIQEMTNFD